MLSPCPVAHGTGRWDATEMPRGAPGKRVGATVARWHPGGHSPDRSQWLPTGSVIAAVRNGELAEQLARVGIASESAETEGRTCMME